MIVYCPRHRIGYNDELDPACPQCAMAHWEPPEPWPVEMTPGHENYGKPKPPAGHKVDVAKLPNLVGRRQ